VGQLIAGVLAASQAIAQRAAKLVNVEYKDLPAIISIEDAIAANSYFPAKMSSIKKGDMEATIASSDHIIKGMTRNGAQEHFYLETNAFVAVPNNEEEWK
jgi:xanthine dehydrogenase/oxidase